MRKFALGLAAVSILLPVGIFAQSHPKPTQATDIRDEDIKAVLKNAPPAVDQQLKVVDCGPYNLGVGIIHREPTKDRADGAVPGLIHHNQTETYIIVSGTGTLVTGGTLLEPKEVAATSEVYKTLNGPSVTGIVKDGFYARVVKPGDVIIIPPDVFHGWIKVSDHVDYLSVRPDPDRVLPAGYVNPTISGKK